MGTVTRGGQGSAAATVREAAGATVAAGSARLTQYLREDDLAPGPAGQEKIHRMATTRFRFALTEGDMPERAWHAIAAPNGQRDPAGRHFWQAGRPVRRSSIPALVCIDQEGLIRRTAYEQLHQVVVGGSDGGRLWTVTDLWDFGVNLPPQPPTAA